MCETVAVGLSGGVDSFVTAMMLLKQGYRVVGIYLQLWKEEGRAEIARLCNRLGIEFVCYDGNAVFRKQVVDLFVKEYLEGHTPNPCAICNNVVKWNLLAEVADSLGIEKLATGHYVYIVRKEKGWYIKKGKDIHKDQSYFLWGLKQNILARTLTPLGDYTKAEVKVYAETNGYPEMARKKESMGICFLEGKDYRDFIRQYDLNAGLMKEGEIVDLSGKVIGSHSGLINYTVGQKRGMPLCAGNPVYVARMDAKSNRIVAGAKPDLYQDRLLVSKVNLFCPEDIYEEDITVKIRGLGINPQGSAAFEPLSDDTWLIRLSSPAWAVASGQPVAFYQGEYLIGGGIAL